LRFCTRRSSTLQRRRVDQGISANQRARRLEAGNQFPVCGESSSWIVLVAPLFQRERTHVSRNGAMSGEKKPSSRRVYGNCRRASGLNPKCAGAHPKFGIRNARSRWPRTMIWRAGMHPKKTTKPDFHQTLTCAALATITTLGTFSLVANVMTPLVSGLHLPTTGLSAQEMRANQPSIEDTVCVQTAHMDGSTSSSRPSLI
jgi:hypothetical protein